MSTQPQEKALSKAPPSLVMKFASKYGVDSDKMLVTLKATAFKQKEDVEITNEQMMALLIVADQYGLNPFTREIYAFPDKNKGIVPVVGVDGWSRIINGHKQYDGMDFISSVETEQYTDAKVCPVAITCTMYRKDRTHPTIVTEYLDECYRPPMGEYKTKGPWQSHTKRLLRHKAMIQCARIAFSFVGIYDEDEADRIIGGVTIDAEPVSHESQETQDLNETILKGNKQESETVEPAENDAGKTNKIDILTQIKDATNEDELLGLEALILDLPKKDQTACKKEVEKRKEKLSAEPVES